MSLKDETTLTIINNLKQSTSIHDPEITIGYLEIAEYILGRPEPVYTRIYVQQDTLKLEFSFSLHFESSSAQLIKKNTLFSVLEAYRHAWHNLTAKPGQECILECCLCLVDGNRVIYYHQLFWKLIEHSSYFKKIPESEFLTRYFGEQAKIYRKNTKDSLGGDVVRCLDEILKTELHLMDWKDIFDQDFFESCSQDQHNFTTTKVSWKSSYSTIPLYKTNESEELDQIPVYRIIAQHCENCKVIYYIPQQLNLQVPFHGGEEYTSLLPLDQKTKDIAQAFTQVIHKALPSGQAVVMGKILAGEKLSDTERNTKAQIKKKLIRLQQLHEMWNDIWPIFAQE